MKIYNVLLIPVLSLHVSTALLTDAWAPPKRRLPQYQYRSDAQELTLEHALKLKTNNLNSDGFHYAQQRFSHTHGPQPPRGQYLTLFKDRKVVRGQTYILAPNSPYVSKNTPVGSPITFF